MIHGGDGHHGAGVLRDLGRDSDARQGESREPAGRSSRRERSDREGERVSSTQVGTDRPAVEPEDGTLGDPLLLVSILGGARAHASIRQHLRAALSALDHTQDEGVLLLNAAGGIESASGSAQRVLSDLPGGRAVRLPEQLATWHANAPGTLIISTDGSTLLVVEATEDCSVRLLAEHSPRAGKLTAREREVMRCVEDGLSNVEIARRLWIQPATVRKHLENVFAKLGVRSRTAALSKLHASEAKAS